MIYTKKTALAMQIAYRAHAGQVDPGNVPYIFHPMHVAEQMATERECIVALLHDVVEDTSVTIEFLAHYFDEEVIEALKLLTHDKNDKYFDYIKKIKPNPIARKVKLADLKHNSTTSRLNKVTFKDVARLIKYRRAINYLSSK